MPESREFTYSCSGKLSVKTPEEISDICVRWYQWHRCWIYGVAPELHLPSSMPVPFGVATEVVCTRVSAPTVEVSSESYPVQRGMYSRSTETRVFCEF